MDLLDAIEESKRLLVIASLKEKQEAAIMSFLGGRDTVVSLPTGYGKSLIYALLPHAFDMIRGRLVFKKLFQNSNSIIVCISPLLL